MIQNSCELIHFEGLDPLIAAFNDVVRQFRAKGHDLLDFHMNKFDRDYVDFNVQVSSGYFIAVLFLCADLILI